MSDPKPYTPEEIAAIRLNYDPGIPPGYERWIEPRWIATYDAMKAERDNFRELLREGGWNVTIGRPGVRPSEACAPRDEDAASENLNRSET